MTLFFEVLLQPVLAVLPIIESPVRVVSELISGIYKVCGKDVEVREIRILCCWRSHSEGGASWLSYVHLAENCPGSQQPWRGFRMNQTLLGVIFSPCAPGLSSLPPTWGTFPQAPLASPKAIPSPPPPSVATVSVHVCLHFPHAHPSLLCVLLFHFSSKYCFFYLVSHSLWFCRLTLVPVFLMCFSKGYQLSDHQTIS